MEFYLLAPIGVVFHGTVRQITLPTAVGQITVLPHHEDYNVLVVPGDVVVRSSGSPSHAFTLHGGVLNIQNNVARLIASVTPLSHDDIYGAIDAAVHHATELKAVTATRVGLHQAQELLDRHPVRLEVSKLRRRHRTRR